MKSEYHGHLTMADGTHVPLTKEAAAELWRDAEAAREKRAADMPDDQAALRVLFEAFQRLKELGWREAIYCPKDGRAFDAIEAGSTGIHECRYHGDWPNGSWDIYADSDVWGSHPILYRDRQ